ncbi:uncharacterized protein LOC129927112 [Biomphalaria glabrata]|uniref:Uncharacterized protein LOC129927112 n=1 Tax=Biomphalaria glabrata TaxID=6526 RepID=A0A9W3ASS6_BIOGL|nr:uncharacterized protein LOC129927112 [Biomphalaria glabrata]
MQLHHIYNMLVQSVVPLLVLTILSVSSTDGCYSSDFKLVERNLVEELLAERNLDKEYASLVLNDKRYLALKYELYKLEHFLKDDAWHEWIKQGHGRSVFIRPGKRSLENLNESTSSQSTKRGVKKRHWQRNLESSSGQAKFVSKASFAVIVLGLLVQLFKRRQLHLY